MIFTFSGFIREEWAALGKTASRAHIPPMRKLLLLLPVILLTSCGPEKPPAPAEAKWQADLRNLLTEAKTSPGLRGAAIGLCVLDAQGAVIFDDQAHTAFIPASALKTVTTATALEILGPDFRFMTEIRAASPMQSGLLEGDLVLVGGGDPILDLAALEQIAAKLHAIGLRRITGGIRIDTSFFKGSLYRDFWNWGDIGNGYGSGVSALNLNHNRYTARFRPGNAPGQPATFLGADPEVPGVTFRNEVITGAAGSGDGVMIHGGENTPIIHLRGTVPLDAKNFTVTGAVPNPSTFAAHHFQRLLTARGIQIDGRIASNTNPAKVFLLQHTSPTLLDIITSIHATSDNHETECVLGLLGHQKQRDSIAIIRDHWKARGLDFTRMRMEDGSGLSRADFITPHDLAKLQHLAKTGPQGAAYRASLLSEGPLHWKGGAMSGIRTLTGYLQTDSGHEISITLMVNHFSDSSAAGELRDKVLNLLQGTNLTR
jgi:D-alanyl-D-alanine carboxypeptidase/D-alanyl-D-alanine-endopeptidase (penicillin-binding protein 4)